MSDSEAELLIHDVEEVDNFDNEEENKECIDCKFFIPKNHFSSECMICDNGSKFKNKEMCKISVDETDLIEWLSICDSIIDLLVRYKVSNIFPFNLCYQTLIALKDSIQCYKNEN